MQDIIKIISTEFVTTLLTQVSWTNHLAIMNYQIKKYYRKNYRNWLILQKYQKHDGISVNRLTSCKPISNNMMTDKLQKKLNIDGFNIRNEQEKIRNKIRLTGQFSAIDETLTEKENLMIIWKLRQISNPEKRAKELLEYFELPDDTKQPVTTFSGGMKRKRDIAMSLLSHIWGFYLNTVTFPVLRVRC